MKEGSLLNRARERAIWSSMLGGFSATLPALRHSFTTPRAPTMTAITSLHTMHASPLAALRPQLLIQSKAFVLWLSILCVATAAKNISKKMSKNKFPTRKLNDSGECPFPFIFFHEPIAGVKKHPGKLILCILTWMFMHMRAAV